MAAKKKEEKRYFWLKLYSDFFNSARIKKLRKVAGGDTYTIIYLKMQLKALNQDGYLYFNGYFGDFYEELALDIDEDATNVRITCEYLISVGLLEVSADGKEYYLTYLKNCIGSESASAQRVRDHRNREREKQKALQCNENVTKPLQCNAQPLQCNTQPLQCNTDVTTSNADVTQVLRHGNAEIDIEKEIDKEIEIDRSIDQKKFSNLDYDAQKEILDNIRFAWNGLNSYGIARLHILECVTSERGQNLAKRLDTYGINSFTQLIEEIKQSAYLRGDAGYAPATFNWAVGTDEVYGRIISGYYREWKPKKADKQVNWQGSSFDSELEEKLLDN